MKKYLCGILMLFLTSAAAFSQSQTIKLDNFSFFLTPKILKDTVITETGLGFDYTEKLSAALRFRYTTIAKNEELAGVEDSLNAMKEKIYETYFLPVEYTLLESSKSSIRLGGGFYYNYDTLDEKGFFNMPELENMTPSRERVNSFTNDFSMHLIGPLLDIGYSYTSEWFSASLFGGIVPVFFLHSYQKMEMTPLLDPDFAEYTQNTGGSPYLYLSFNSVILKYINLSVVYDFARLKYSLLDFDSDLNWITPESAVSTQTLNIEASLLLPLDDRMSFQVGYGFSRLTTHSDSGTNLNDNRHYLILTMRKNGN